MISGVTAVTAAGGAALSAIVTATMPTKMMEAATGPRQLRTTLGFWLIL
jgi:hypothetical protein